MINTENTNGQQACQIKDSGSRRQFESGAVRDIQEGKGRCDLLPIDVIASLMEDTRSASVVYHIGEFMESGHDCELFKAIVAFQELSGYEHIGELLLDVSVHYEQGADKYGERNWEKGIPLHCYIDSGLRHFLKYKSNQVDERHDRAFVWNMLGAIWTMKHKPDLIDIPFQLIGEYKKTIQVDDNPAGGSVSDSPKSHPDTSTCDESESSHVKHGHVHGYFSDPKLAGHVGF